MLSEDQGLVVENDGGIVVIECRDGCLIPMGTEVTITTDRAALLQRIEAAELSEEIARKDSRKYEEFYHGVRDELRNENAVLLSRPEQAKAVAVAAQTVMDAIGDCVDIHFGGLHKSDIICNDECEIPAAARQLRSILAAYQEASDA